MLGFNRTSSGGLDPVLHPGPQGRSRDVHRRRGSGTARLLSGARAPAETVDDFSAGPSEPTVWGLCHVLLLHLIFLVRWVEPRALDEEAQSGLCCTAGKQQRC